MVVNFTCQRDWATELRYVVKRSLKCFCEGVFLGEMNIYIGKL